MTPNPKIVFIVVLSLAGAVGGGMFATYMLIMNQADAALIAIISGHTGTALGGLMSILSRTGATSDPAHPVPASGTQLVADGKPVSKDNPLPTNETEPTP